MSVVRHSGDRARQERSIALSVSGHRTPDPRLRLERSSMLPAGTVVVALIERELVLTFGETASVATSIVASPEHPARVSTLTLREGDMELLIHVPASLGPSRRDTVDRDEAPEGGDCDLTRVYVRPGSRPSDVIRQRPGTRAIAVGSDVPTRMLSVAAVLATAPAGARGQSGTTPSSHRRIVRRGVLLAALIVAFGLATGMRRVRDSLGLRRAPVTDGRPARTGDAAHGERSGATPAPIAPPAVTEARAAAPSKAPSISPPAELSREPLAVLTATPAGSSKTKARVAADAFATGDYAQALALYQELAGEHPADQAYVHAANVLRSWLFISRSAK
jgi:hypothetical protein